ncbi:hypothetical protein EKO27_g6090 [Xylaria grammica]|uniref:Rhodopsin domain-containing protein n=1 Tax=Xylaria grammica TaxID=363999 RepID=A0A439D3N5_9PEZI|nr:hypothetical protein EKO27_g6090 [Xylaria grammica]
MQKMSIPRQSKTVKGGQQSSVRKGPPFEYGMRAFRFFVFLENMLPLESRSPRLGPGVPYDGFLSPLGPAFIFVIIRLCSRFRGPGRLYWDDAFVIFALALSIVTAALWQWQAPNMYFILNVSAGFTPPTPEIFQKQIIWLKVSLIVELFFYTGSTCVKLSFLFFFRRLGHNVSKFRYLWWPVFLFTIAVWLAAIGNVQYHCLVGSLEELNGYCDTEPAINFTTITLKVNCALDVFTDFLIMLIPFTLLWNVRMRWRRKLAFLGIFSLSIVTMVIATVRAADVAATKWVTGQNDPTYLWLWSAVEPCIAIIVSCASAFPQLFVQSSQKALVFTPSETYLEKLKRIRLGKRNDITLYDLSGVTKTHNSGYMRTQETDVASYKSSYPVLTPGEDQSAPVCYAALPVTAPRSTLKNSIIQERGYSVTREEAISP